MYDPYASPYGDELRQLEENYAKDDEGLSADEYYEKYASDGYKQWEKETIAYFDEMEKQGVWI